MIIRNQLAQHLILCEVASSNRWFFEMLQHNDFAERHEEAWPRIMCWSTARAFLPPSNPQQNLNPFGFGTSFPQFSRGLKLFGEMASHQRKERFSVTCSNACSHKRVLSPAAFSQLLPFLLHDIYSAAIFSISPLQSSLHQLKDTILLGLFASLWDSCRRHFLARGLGFPA